MPNLKIRYGSCLVYTMRIYKRINRCLVQEYNAGPVSMAVTLNTKVLTHAGVLLETIIIIIIIIISIIF